jgi:hypothetical protein
VRSAGPANEVQREKVAAASSTSRTEEKAFYMRGIDYLRDEHRTGFAQMIKLEGPYGPKWTSGARKSIYC